VTRAIGILGSGQLADYLMTGAAGAGFDFILSPGRRAADLAERHGARVCDTNQQVLDRADHILVCLPAKAGPEILQTLRFGPQHSVLSAMAGSRMAPLGPAIAPARLNLTMMPGHANALRCGPSLLYPTDPFWHGFLSTCGTVIPCNTEAEFAAAAPFGALSGASFPFMATLIDWFIAQGLPADMARTLVAETLRGNAQVLATDPAPVAEIARGVATPGGITEQLVADLTEEDALSAWQTALSALQKRMKK
jgi:pyrroline-5-carboxylate reductase